MEGYEYGNTRVRVMKSRLLKPDQIMELAHAGGIDRWITSLSRTSYQRAVEAAVSMASGMACVPIIFRRHLAETLKKIPSFYSDRPGQLIRLLFLRYVIQNIKTILRQLGLGTPQEEILSGLSLIGTVPEAILGELAISEQPRMAIDRMASMRLPFAAPLLELRSSQPGASPQQIERSLEQWYFTQVASILKEDGSRDDLIARSIWLDADLVNLMVCLRRAHQPEENGRPADLLDWMVQPGSIRLDLLEQCISQPDVESCVRTGYIALKENEIYNLRQTALLIHLGFDPNEIIANLEIVP